MARKGENIYKRKDGRYEGRYIKERTDMGKIHWGYVYARTYREVRTRLRQARIAHDNAVMQQTTNEKKMQETSADNLSVSTQGQQQVSGPPSTPAAPCTSKKPEISSPLTAYPAEEESKTTTDSISFITDQWLKSMRSEVKPSTYNKYLNQINNYLLPAFGEMRAEDITDDTVLNFCADLQTTGGAKGQGLSAKTVTDSLSVLRRILRFSYNKGYSPTLVCPEAKVRKEEKEIRVLSDKEQERLCAYLKKDLNNPRKRGVLLCLFTGLRIGELCGLTWDDISFSDRTLRIERTMQRLQIHNGQGPKTMISISTPKSACSIRTIPLMDDMAQILEAHRGTGYILTDSTEKFATCTVDNPKYSPTIRCFE